MSYRLASFCMRESYLQLGELEFNSLVYSENLMIVLNVHVPTEDKNDDSYDSFYEELK